MSAPIRHVLSLSGGKDSAALAIYMRDRVPDMEYLFHDALKELPETIDYLERLEAVLGKPITRSSSTDTFDHWLKIYRYMLPSNGRRWCTKMLKLRPFEEYIGDDPVINYIGLRADENRTGYISTKPNITPRYPFQEDGLVRADIIRILEDSGLGLPPYMAWGRTRSGCFFCFYQQRIEWVRLKQVHPELYQEAKEYERLSADRSDGFTWNERETLAELEQPERMQQIIDEWEAAQARKMKKRKNISLAETLAGHVDEDEPNERDGCLVCAL